MTPEAMLQHAVSLHERGDLDAAASLYDQLLAQFPTHADCLQLRGLIAIHQGAFQEALQWIDRAIAVMPDHGATYANRAAAHLALGDYESALADAEDAVRLEPLSRAGHSNKIRALNLLGRFAEALAAADHAVTRGVKDAGLHVQRAESFIALQQYEDAVRACDAAILLNPELPEGHGNRAYVLTKLRRGDEAAASFDKALALNPDSPEGHSSHAVALLFKRAPDEAVASCNRALALRPAFPGALIVRAMAHEEAKRYDAAIADCAAALELQPDDPNIFVLRSRIYKATKRLELALADIEMAIALAPEMDEVYGERAYFSLRLCEWENIASYTAEILAGIDAGKCPAAPWITNVLPSSPVQQQQVAERYCRAHFPQVAVTPSPVRGSKIRVAYFSCDFSDHPTSHLILGCMEAHDRAQFEILVFAYGGDPNEATRRRIAKSCDSWVDASKMSGPAIAALAREANVHIAVDLNGYTADSRTDIFAEGAAPIQVNYLAFPGTMGSDNIHYIIGDRIVTPLEDAVFFNEKIVTMPQCYQPNSVIKREAISALPSRRECGLPETGFVFCCFNSLFKVTPDVFDIWMRLLTAVDGSVLWLLGDNATAVRNLKKEAHQRGIAPERLIFAPRAPVGPFLARFALADLFLDTFPCTAHTTCGDALLMGVPVVTRKGETFMSRVAASLLHVVGLRELVAETEADYERTALMLATRPERLAALRTRLAQETATGPLFDARRYARNLETAYREMWLRHERGLPPDHIAVLEQT